jgi:hypothetical protein
MWGFSEDIRKLDEIGVTSLELSKVYLPKRKEKKNAVTLSNLWCGTQGIYAAESETKNVFSSIFYFYFYFIYIYILWLPDIC